MSISHAISAHPGSIKKFFENLRKWVADWKLEAEPNRIWNVDECGVGDVPKTQKVIGITGERAFQTSGREGIQHNYCDICQCWWNNDQTNGDTKGSKSTY